MAGRSRPAHHPMRPAQYDKATIAAIRALVEGIASEGQQKRVVEWIVQDVARIHDLSMFSGPDGERLTAFAEGRRFVGLQIVKMLNPMTLKALEASDKRGGAKD